MAVGKRLAISFAAAAASVVAWHTIAWCVVHAQSSRPANPFVDGIAGKVPGGASVYFREAGGTYANLQFNETRPFGLISAMSTLTQLLSGGLKNVYAGSAGPAGVGLQSQTFATADLNGNGSIGAVQTGGNGIGVYQGTSGLLYRALLNYQIGPDPNSVAFGDFNRDGNADIAVAYDGSTTVPGGIAILLGKGDGTFGSPVTYARGTTATHFVVLDLNHDGILDIATASLNQMVTVLLGKGDGSFGSPTPYAVGGSGQAIAAADIDGDGNPDIIAGGTAGVLLGNGDGTFHAGTPLPPAASGTLIWAFAAGDLNGDSKMDLVYADIENQVFVPMFGDGHGAFQVGQAYAVSELPDAVMLIDYNNDGRLDIVNGSGDARCFTSADNSSAISILLNNSDGTFQGAPAYFTLPNSEAAGSFTLINGMAVGNFGGGSPGILASGFGGLTLFRGDGKGGLRTPQAIAFSGAAGPLVAADFDGDGKADAAVVGGSGISVLLSNATGFNPPHNVSSGGSSPSALAAGDFDQDGKQDLAVVNAGTPGTLAFLKGNGDGTFQQPITIPAGITPTSLLAADINGDGKLDLVFGDSGTNGVGGAVYVSVNLGGGLFHTPVNVFPASFPVVAVGDANGDGRLDLIASSEGPVIGQATLYWLQGNGNGTFQAPVAITTVSDTDNAVLLQDFNNDGHPDIIVSHQSSDATFLAGNGDGTFYDAVHPTRLLAAAQPIFLQAADLNGDGKPDLVVGGFTITVLLNNAIPTARTLNSASFTEAVASGSIASAFGSDLANGSTNSSTKVTLTDSAGVAQQCTLFYVSPGQVNFLIPATAAPGLATLTVQSGDGTVSKGTPTLNAVAPGIYTADGRLAAALVVVGTVSGAQTTTLLVTANAAGTLATTPISLDPPSNQVFLLLYGTGIRGAPLSQVSVQVGSQNITPAYAGAAPGYPGEDQINVQLPYSLKGTGDAAVTVTASGQQSNTVHVQIQ